MPTATRSRRHASKQRLLARNQVYEDVLCRARRRGWPRPAARCPSASCAAAGCWRSAADPYATDAQHVSVEFVHPVIVGKRALAGARSLA